MKCVKGLGFLWVAVLAAFFALSACDDSSSASSNGPDENATVDSSSSICKDCDDESSSSAKKIDSSAEKNVESSDDAETGKSSSSKENRTSSSSVKTGESSSSKKDVSSSSVNSSSSKITDYTGVECETIGSTYRDGRTGIRYVCGEDYKYKVWVPEESSSSGPYEPFDQTLPLKKFEEERYKTFTDSRNGRVYYTIDVMAQNLNIADVTLKAGENMTDDTKIERYCYNDDTTKCDRYGGLYQWAEMMGFNDSCNTKSCADLIQPNHQGICPKGWRLMTRHDFEVARSSTEYGVHGLRSEYIFTGNNESGLSLTGAGAYFNQRGFADLDSAFYMFYPSESVFQDKVLALGQVISRYTDGSGTARGSKFDAFSVRCVKLK